MGHRWLLSLLCLSVLFLSLVQLTRAGGELRVNEALTKILLEKEPAEVLLAVENSSGQSAKVRVQLELLDPQSRVTAQTSRIHPIATGSQTLSLSLPVSFSKLTDKEHRQFLWYRLRYRLSEEGSPANTITEGIVSVSEIANDLFEIKVATSEVVREGRRYRARVQATHPITRRPVAGVRVDGEIKLEDDDDRSVELHTSEITDAEGYALLDFALPPRFTEFPDGVLPEDAEITVVAQKGAIVAEANGDLLLDQYPSILINSDKPLYQPGQVMHIRALLFSPSKRVLANQNILIRICDPEDLTVFRTVVRGSRFGIVNTDWPIPANTRLGDYRIWVGLENESENGRAVHDVRISRYDLPNFTVSVDPDRKFYLPGQNAEVKVRADYLFGQPVTRGHVRVVRESRREWNYREQKWDVKEGDEYEGETDAKGFFVARIDLASDHEDISDSEYERFKDATYAAYFSDPTTNRTEQRRFDLRVTKEAIHVYVGAGHYYLNQSHSLPLQFYVSTSYPDGSPAACKVNVKVTTSGDESQKDVTEVPLATLQTNRYGLAKITGVRMPREFENKSYVDLVFSASDSQGQSGSKKEGLSLDNDERVIVETGKALYRAGEPIIAQLTSNTPNQTLRVELVRDWTVIRSERVQLRNGRGSVTFAYKPDFKDKVTIAAYSDFTESSHSVGTRTILYPRNSELKLNVRTSQASYRPGEDAQVSINARAPEGRGTESALGVVVLDKAVEERFRTDREFGGRPLTFNESLQRFLGLDEQVAGVTLRDLQGLDMSKAVSPDLDLVAEVMLSVGGDYYPRFFGGDQYEPVPANVFEEVIKEGLKPLQQALARRYIDSAQYPNSEISLRRLLLESHLEFNSFHDPWGTNYRPVFSIAKNADVLTFVTAGADKRFDTADDFSVEPMSWPYFRPIGEAIDRAVGRHHDRTGGFIRDLAALREEVSRDSLDLGRTLDRWGEPYRFEFEVKDSHYVIKVRSGGPDRKFSTYPDSRGDEFIIWTSAIDYFAEPRARIQATLNEYSRSAKKFPQDERELRAALGDSFAGLRDPWGHPYYSTFTTQYVYNDRVRVENRATFGQPGVARTEITPVTQKLAVIALRSVGVDEQPGTADDFSVATFSGLTSEQTRADALPQPVSSGVVVSLTSGMIYGVVTDVNGAVIPATAITVTAAFGPQSYRSSSNEDGKYSVPDLSPGFYEVRFEAPGFMASVFTNVLVRASTITEVNATLQAGAVQEAVTVTGDASGLLNATASASASVISRSVVSVVTKPGGPPPVSTPRLREYFPETLLWQPSIETDKQGRARINFKLADNITTWKLAVVGSTADGLMGTSETEIKSFQPFFVEHDPPRVLTEGDEILLPVVVRNYLQQAQKVDLEIKREPWFSLLGPARKQASVNAGDATRETFDFRAIASIRDGKQRITATGTADANDAIEKPVTVHPDGEELSVTAGNILGDSATLDLDIPENMIPNSKQGELKIYPNLMAHLLESVESIMARPYGCGEQTISSTYPSLLLLRHYKESREEFPLRARAERYLNDGYSRLLNYRDESGGFTYWGRGNPDLALTAYALRFLTDAAGVISVDENVINYARDWLTKKQLSDGSWTPEYLSDSTDAKRAGILLTAHITRMLAKTEAGRSESKPEVSAAIKRALNYLSLPAAQIDEPYLLASYALAAIDAGEIARAKPVIEKLRLLGHAEGSTTYWSLETNTPFYGWGLTGRIETTALVVQALTRYCDSQTAKCGQSSPEIRSGLLFLLKQKDRFGVWYSTQATINVLDAMLAWFATDSTQRNSATQSEAQILVNGRVVRTIQMPAGNRLLNPITLDISEFVRAGKNRVEIRRATGSSFASVQGVVNYYVHWAASRVENHASGLRLVAKFDKTGGKVNDTITCHVEAERVGFYGYGMMLAEIGLPPGAEVDRGSLETAMKSSGWTFTQYDVLPDRVVMYLWPRAGGVKFDFQFRPRFGLNAKTAPSVIYDYYNPEARAVLAPVMFKVK
jgi:A-macroglobulin TED domain/Alpha-2-macroglobulin family/Carboxypeptidase regulatory-like domain/MG2 domain/A-macroglobulin receptor binding domain/Macroglobulin domain MG3/Alpha-2-macroglobulin bait region domain